MPVPNIPNMLVVPLLDTVTFNMIWEDIQCSGELSTLIITEREANATARSALFTCWGSSDIEPNNHILSPLSDTGLSQIFNIDGTLWAFELTTATQKPYPMSPPMHPLLCSVPTVHFFFPQVSRHLSQAV